MRTSIRFRTILAMNLLVLGVGGLVTFIGASVAGQVVEERLVGQVARNAAGLVGSMNLPITDTLVGHLRRIFGVDFVAMRRSDGVVMGSTVPSHQAAELRRTLQKHGSSPAAVKLGGREYHLSIQPLEPRDPRSGPVDLVLLVPRSQIEAAQARARGRVAVVAVPALIVATLLAGVLSWTITRPIRRLARTMDRTADLPADRYGLDHPTAADLSGGAPTEVAQLGEAFGRLLKRLADARAQLARNERLAAAGKLSAAVAHELRNPLSGIKMNARLLRDELAEAGHEDEAIDIILAEIDRMDLFLQDLLDVAADGPSVPQTITPQPVDAAETAGGVQSLLAGKLRHADVSLRLSADPACPPASADPRRLRQVLMNLLLNALEASPPGSTIHIDIAPEDEGKAVRITVGDEGPGLPEGQPLYEPFATTKSGGAGLGLYVTRQIVDALGGTIQAANHPSGGARFTVTLPAAGNG